MRAAKQVLRRVVPEPVWEAAAARYRRLRRDLAWYGSVRRCLSVRRLQKLRDVGHGKRCFIIGNGPSLRQMDLSPLYHEQTFGLNRIYLLFPTLGFQTSYLVCVNRLVIEQCGSEMALLPMPQFLSWDARRWVPFGGRTVFVRSSDCPLGFSTDPGRCVHEGATVTYVALQLAYYMGFAQVILVGVDHSFATQGRPHQEVVSQGDDPNHFSPDYFGHGFRWQLPDLETSEAAYRLAQEAYERDGREVVDATVGGRLKVFPKARYEELF